MTYKKFTDEEIIKVALEEEIHLAEYVDSDYCSNTEVSLLKSTLDLINQQKSEIERLNKKVEELSEVLSDSIRIRYAEAKAEAYKECIEKVKEKAIKIECVCSGALVKTDYTITDKELDNIIKETDGK